ncbi:MAG: hypothetical protein Q7W30_05340 [Coriobacteriia bacterium]|nr:hypothetical protein [Coriobacteriia bacterium]
MRRGFACVLLTLAVFASGCAASSSDGAGAAEGGMGMSGASPGASNIMFGSIAASGSAVVEPASPALSARGIRLARVVAPVDGWIVARSFDATGAVLGATRVARGESRDVLVPLGAVDGGPVRVALHTDRGRTGVLEYDPVRPERAIDKPIFAGGDPVEIVTPLSGYGVEAIPNTALIMVEPQDRGSQAVIVEYLLVPDASWILVNVSDRGVPGRRLGIVGKAAGEYQEIAVPLKAGPVPGSVTELVVTVLADRGERGRLEFSETDPLGSVDQPWRSAGVVVSQRVPVR